MSLHVNTLPETNSSPLKMDGWNTTFLLGFGLFSGAFAVSFREGNWFWGGPSLVHLAQLAFPEHLRFGS